MPVLIAIVDDLADWTLVRAHDGVPDPEVAEHAGIPDALLYLAELNADLDARPVLGPAAADDGPAVLRLAPDPDIVAGG